MWQDWQIGFVIVAIGIGFYAVLDALRAINKNLIQCMNHLAALAPLDTRLTASVDALERIHGSLIGLRNQLAREADIDD
jgi:hypothetical protein